MKFPAIEVGVTNLNMFSLSPVLKTLKQTLT